MVLCSWPTSALLWSDTKGPPPYEHLVAPTRHESMDYTTITGFKVYTQLTVHDNHKLGNRPEGDHDLPVYVFEKVLYLVTPPSRWSQIRL